MRKILIFCLAAVSLPSCKILTPSVMLRTKANFQYDTPPEIISPEYKISPNDLMLFQLFSNDGFEIIAQRSIRGDQGSASGFFQNRNQRYLVEFDGLINLPVLGRIQIAGMTLREAELMLEERYSKFYVKPFVTLSVSNRRVMIFPGSGGQARVLRLENENTTVLEALALAGGILSSGKAHKIKLIRGNPKDPDVYLIDLSKIEGIKDGQMVLQANDIIYVEPIFSLPREIVAELGPIVTLISQTVLIWALITGNSTQ